MKEYIKGNYRKSIYSNNGYMVGIFKVRDTNIDDMKEYINKTITFTGFFYELNVDDTYIFYGGLVNNKKYGLQFQVNEFELVKPQDKDGIIEFLASDLFSGIGYKTATSIVDILGEGAIDLIKKDKMVLTKIPHLNDKRIDKIYNTIMKYEEGSSITIYLTELGFNMKVAIALYNRYKNNIKDVILNNVYDLIDEVEDITFLLVDSIYPKLDILDDDKRRVKALIIYVVKDLCYKNSNAYLSYMNIYESVTNYLNFIVDPELFNGYLDELINENKIVLDNNKYYLKKIYVDESYVAKEIVYLASKEIKTNKKIDEYIQIHEKDNNLIYNDKQKDAIKKALQNNIVVITGGPGTGKTTIIKAITSIYQNLNKYSLNELINDIALIAPTGRASKRMSEKTLLPASTIHRFLKWNKETDSFSVNEDNKDYRTMIIVDEVSMIDISLLASLFRGLTHNIKLVLVGDYNQIPSVGIGQVLKDIIESNIVDTIYLDHIYRQDDDSYIPVLADEIKNGELSENYLMTKSDYTFLECNNDDIRVNLKKLCKQIIDKGYDYKNVQIMVPIYHGENGIDILNKELQQVFNPSGDNLDEIIVNDVIYRVNDKVLQLVNMPDDNVFNGDIGIIKLANNKEIKVDFDDNIVTYKIKDLVKIKHAYVISIHKSQGSEFNIGIVPICFGYKRMLYRKLIYTAITRAKKKLIMIGEKDAFLYAVNKAAEDARNSSLREKINNSLYKL